MKVTAAHMAAVTIAACVVGLCCRSVCVCVCVL